MKWIGYKSLADITSITAGTGLSGGGAAGDITLNVDASIPEITTLAGLIAIGTAGAILKTASYSLLDVDRTAAQGNAGAEDITALHVDFDRAVPTSGTYAHNDVGIDLDVNSASLGTSSLTGMDIDVVGAAGGTSKAIGIDLDVDGAEINVGMQINTAGTHMKLVANADEDDYATFTVADTGDLTIETVGDALAHEADLTIKADGRVILEAADGKPVRVYSTETSGADAGPKIVLTANDGAALGDDHRLGKIGFQAAEDGSGTNREGASIQAFADAAWSSTVNDTRLEFYTMDGDNGSELSLTLDSNLLATFAGAVTVTGALTCTTDLATDQQKHLMHYRFMGYGTGDGTNYFLGQPFTDAQSPWEHADSSSGDGTTIPAGGGTNISELIRSGGHVMPRAVTLKKWTGWGTYNGSDDAFVSIYKWTPVDDDSTDITPVLLDTATIDGEGNDKARSFTETSFTQAAVAAGDIIFTQIKTETNSKVVYFNSTLEVEF